MYQQRRLEQMDYYYKDDDDDDEHDEDNLPEISLPMSNYTRKISHEDDQSLDNWRNLYETSVQSLKSDEDEQRSIEQKPFYLERSIPMAQPPSSSLNGRPDSPVSEPEITTDANKSKWEIRLPELLNSTVGPDRQKRETSRRHTTDIVFQQPNELNRFTSPANGHQPVPTLVKQLKQKFDRMTTNNSPTSDSTPNNFHIPKYQRLDSITARGLTTNTGTRLVQRSRPALPIRPSPEITTIRTRPDSVDSRSKTTNRNQRDKLGPPVSYPKHYYPPPSTTSVVKQLIGSGATLVYDSKTQKSSSKPKPLIKNPKSIEQTREELKNTNAVLTGRQLLPEHSKKKKNNPQPPPQDDDSEDNYYDPMVEPSNHHRTYSNASDQEPYYATSNSMNQTN